MTDEADPTPPVTQSAANAQPGVTDPGAGSDPDGEPVGAAAPALPSVSGAQVMAIWSRLGPIGQLIAGASIGVILIALVGAIIDAWQSSGSFALIMVTAGVAAAAAAWFTARDSAGAKSSPIPLETIEFAAGVVATALAVLRLIEMLFDLDDLDDYGGLIGAVLTVAMTIAAGAILVGALRRDPTLRSAVLAGDVGTRLAVAGLVLVVIAWALNLSIGFWNMNAGATSVALLAFGAVLVVVQPRWKSVLAEVPLGWVGAGLAAVTLLLAVGLWGELMDIGLTRVQLDLTDYLPQVLSFLGIIGIIAGGVLAGLAIWQARPKVPVAQPAGPPASESFPPTATPARPAPTAEPASPTEPPPPPA